MTLAQVYMAGNVRRYHANPAMAHLGQTNADHQGRCVQLLFWLHPAPSVALVQAVAHHDVGERWAGDLPAPFKTAEPELAAAHADVEFSFLQKTLDCDILEALEDRDLRWLRLIDRLEAFAFMLSHAPGERHDHGWPEARHGLMAQAWGLDCAAMIDRLLNDLEARAW
jgi:hypothetical protein